MKLTLHHINLSTDNVAKLDDFYQNILGLENEVSGLPKLEKKQGYAGDVAFVSDGAIQMHLAQKDIHAGFKAKQFVNPVSRGHIAFRTEDIKSFKKKLEENNIPYSDWGNQAVEGWEQIFFYDPDGNVIEVHEAKNERD